MALAKNIEIFEHPLDTVEIVASLRDWTYERSETEVSIIAKGKWADYQISVTWVDDYEGINIVCGFDLKFQNIHKDKILELVTSINNNAFLATKNNDLANINSKYAGKLTKFAAETQKVQQTNCM